MDNFYRGLALEMLEDFTLEEILLENDLSSEEVLEVLLQSGLILEPERYFP